MKRSIKLLFFLSLFSVRALSQEAAVTFLFSSIAPCGNSTACVDVTTDDFSNVLYVKMPIKWDPKIVKLKSIQLGTLKNIKLSEDNNVLKGKKKKIRKKTITIEIIPPL